MSLSAVAVGGAVVLYWWPRPRPRSEPRARPGAGERTIEKPAIQEPVIREPVSPWRVKQLRQAIARAKQVEKPLLVLVAPATNDGNVRGTWCGLWFEEMHEEDLWLPASCELACATVAELGDVLDVKVEGAPFWVFVDVGSSRDEKKPARITPIACALPVPDAEDLAVRAFALRAMHEAFAAGAKKHGLELAPFAAAALRRIDASPLDDWFGGGPPPGYALIADAAAEVWRRIEAHPNRETRPERREADIGALRGAVLQSWWFKEFPGARWMAQLPMGPCGSSLGFMHPTESEKETRQRERERAFAREPHGIACGMAAVPRLCSRFLEFWTAGN